MDALNLETINVGAAISTIDAKIVSLTNARSSMLTASNESIKSADLSPDKKALYDALDQELKFQTTLKGEVTKLNLAPAAKIEKTAVVNSAAFDVVLNLFNKSEMTVVSAKKELATGFAALNKKLPLLFEPKKFSFVANNWVDVSNFATTEKPEKEPVSVLQSSDGCDLKIPFKIADLRVIERQSVGYLPGEIAHINNTQSGETNTRVTRRLKRTETLETLFLSDETFSETDTQSTERLSIEKESYAMQSSANATSVQSSAAGSYGPIYATLNAGYSNSNSSSNSNSVSQEQAKEVMTSIVQSVSHKIQTTRSTTTTEEFEEIVTHEIDNKLGGTKSYVYRWLNKLVRGTLKNYGKRLMFEVDVAHPSANYLTRTLQDFPSISLPPDPRTANINGTALFTRDSISRTNYLVFADMYKVSIEEPPKETILVSDVMNSKESVLMGKLIPIPENYECKTAKIISYMNAGWPNGNSLVYTIGKSSRTFWNDAQSDLWISPTFYLAGETEQLPMSVESKQNGYYLNIEITCKLTDQAYTRWKNKVYDAIIEAYESLKESVDEELATFNPNLPGINPSKKMQLIHDELKKLAIKKMFKCNPFWVNDKYVVGEEYDSKCCLDTLNAEKVKFLEAVFDWKNMTYKLHPYFYAQKDNWSDLLVLTDDDPHFEAFLQASFGTLQIPVHRDELMERAAINFIQNNSIANYEVIPEGAGTLLADLNDAQPTKFTTALDGTDLPVPTHVVDLGIFEIPTNLVILECGTADGVKPIGFPESPVAPTSDLLLPKQFSPAIIADSCTIPPVN